MKKCSAKFKYSLFSQFFIEDRARKRWFDRKLMLRAGSVKRKERGEKGNV